jgi:hypothetical protein
MEKITIILAALFLILTISFYIITHKSFQAAEIANATNISKINIPRLIETFHIMTSLFFGLVITKLLREAFKKSSIP